MSASPPTPVDFGELPPIPVRRFTVEEYHRLTEVGVLTENDRVELLEGWILEKMAHNPSHGATLDHARDVLADRLPRGWRVRAQLSVTTADSEPEPDLSVVRGPASRYARRHPTASDLALVVEVSDTSLERDRDVKGPIYARAGFAVYWIVNLVDRKLEVYTDPSGPGAAASYAKREEYGLDEDVPFVIDGREVCRLPVNELFVG